MGVMTSTQFHTNIKKNLIYQRNAKRVENLRNQNVILKISPFIVAPSSGLLRKTMKKKVNFEKKRSKSPTKKTKANKTMSKKLT